MTEFDNLKSRYISTIQLLLSVNVGYNKTKQANEILHKFCENLVDDSNYFIVDKRAMKNELEVIKETLSKEIKSFYKR